jgi:Xaa-Pro dipeptidase
LEITRLASLFSRHIDILQRATEEALARLGLPGLVITTGHETYYFDSDIGHPFKASHHFNHWCPAEGAGHVLVVRPGDRPLLLAHQPVDYWHVVPQVGAGAFWESTLAIERFADLDSLWAQVEARCAGFAFQGPLVRDVAAIGLVAAPKELMSQLDWTRSHKTDYEVACLEEATALAARGHRAAKLEFERGGSELDMYNAFLGATRLLERDLPYQGIFCLDASAAILHYYDKRDDLRNGKVMLIDAGAQVRGYASDITRSYATDEAPAEFRSILAAMATAQRKLCGMVRPGVTNVEIHLASHRLVAEVLLAHGVLAGVSVEAAVDLGLTRDFYPHGIGHMLGILVHDVGAHLINAAGDRAPTDPRFPKLRATRPLTAGNVCTIEPGLYFIDSLLAARRASTLAKHVDWTLVERLMPCGGIRIEDDVLVTADGYRNLTREQLP